MASLISMPATPGSHAREPRQGGMSESRSGSHVRRAMLGSHIGEPCWESLVGEPHQRATLREPHWGTTSERVTPESHTGETHWGSHQREPQQRATLGSHPGEPHWESLLGATSGRATSGSHVGRATPGATSEQIQTDWRRTYTNRHVTWSKGKHFLKSCTYTGTALCDYHFKTRKNFLNNRGNKQAMKLPGLAA